MRRGRNVRNVWNDFAIGNDGNEMPVLVAISFPSFLSFPAGKTFLSFQSGPLSLASLASSSCAWPLFAARGSARLQKPERCTTHSSLFLPLAAVAVRAPAGGAKCTAVKPGKRSGKAKAQTSLPYHRLTDTHGRALASPCGRESRVEGRRQGQR